MVVAVIGRRAGGSSWLKNLRGQLTDVSRFLPKNLILYHDIATTLIEWEILERS